MAIILDRANLGDTVNFSLWSGTAAIIRTDFTGCKLLALIDAESVPLYNVDPYSMHANVYGTLPAGTPVSASDYLWLKIKLANGSITAIGLPYIIPETLVVVSGSTAAFYVDNITQDAMTKITQAIAAAGYTVSKTVIVQ